MMIQAYKQLIKISIPMIATSLASMLASIIGMFFVARLGHEQLAAGALVSSTYVTLLVLATGSMYAVSILVAGIHRDNCLSIKQLFHTAMAVGLLLMLFVGLFFYFSGDILRLFRQDPTLIAYTVTYFHRMLFALLFIIPFMVFQQFFIGTERPQVNFKVTMVSLASTTFFSYIFILGKFGCAPMGLGGLALAQIFGFILSCGLYFYFAIQLGDQKKYQLITHHLSIDWTMAGKILKIGLPIGIQYAAELASMAVATYFIGWLGAQVLAASQISSQISMLAVMIFLALSQATAVLVSQAMSRGQVDLALDYNRVSNLVGISMMLIVLLILVTVPQYLIHLYVNINAPENQFIVAQAKSLMAVSGLVLVFDASRNILAGSLRGIHDSQSPMLWSILCQWVIALPAAYLLGFIFHYGAAGIRFGFVIGFALCAIILAIRFRQKMKKFLILEPQCQ
jgi:multidrug resistance protein, MATE family